MLKLTLATPEKAVYSGELSKLTLIAEKGQIQILENHAPLLTLVKPGNVRAAELDGGEKLFTVSEGVLRVQDNEMSMLVQTAVEA